MYQASLDPKSIEINNFLGLNESIGDTEIKIGEAIYMRNFRITSNYKLEKRTGHTTFIDETQPTKVIQGLWYGKILGVSVLIYACNGNVKKKVMPSGAVSTLGTMTDAKTNIFYFQGKLFLLNGTEYKYYDGTTFGNVTSIAYVPKVATGSPPTGGGTLLEEINVLTGKKSQEFVGNGVATLYQLVEIGLTSVDSVYVNGVLKTVTTDYTVDLVNGRVTFVVAPVNLAVVLIAWNKSSTATPSLVTSNRSSILFGPGNDTTVFMWGSTTNPNRRTFSASLDATYFPANNYTDIGSNQYAITDIQPMQGVQIIFKEEQTYYSPAEIAVSPLTGYVYPIYDLNYAIGNVCFDGVQVVKNNPVSLHGNSAWEWTSSQVKDERNAKDISIKMPVSFGSLDFTTAVTFDYQKNQELWINVGSMVYVWNYGNDTWCIYDNISANCFLEVDGVVYFGSKVGTIERFEGKLTDNGTIINAVWKSGFIDFGAYEYKKNSRSMWFSIQPASRTSVSIKCPTNRNNEDDPVLKTFTKGYTLFDFETIDFDDFTFETNRNPQAFRIDIKAKKYSYIQFIFSNAQDDETLVFLSFKVDCETTSFVK